MNETFVSGFLYAPLISPQRLTVPFAANHPIFCD
jgi:hypothetical protein